MRVVIATSNPGKRSEFREMLACDRLEWIDPPVQPLVEETGRTFADNALLKASAFARANGCWALADDSGLCVDALSGKPGVRSARWAADHAAGEGEHANNRLLLRQLEQVDDPDRTARFCCVLVLADPHGRGVLLTSGSVEGRITRAPRGDGGFGYDPLFELPQTGRTTAELSPDQKHQISHRGIALRRMRQLMQRTLG